MTIDSRDEKAQHVLALMTDELMSLRQSCKAVGIATSTFLLWTAQDPELSEQYAKARDALIDGIADEIMDISDMSPPMKPDGSLDGAGVAHQRLRVDTRKWLLSKVAPKKYGDRIEVAGDKNAPLVTAVHVEFIKP